jgi:alginate O-acetyltransferase complex protein AlgI
MIFNSIGFFIFFAVVLCILYVLPAKHRWIWVLAASTFFYVYAKPEYILVPLFITVFTYYAGLWIENALSDQRKQTTFNASVIIIIAALVFFKYTNFFISTFNDLLNLVTNKQAANNLVLDIAVPIGISYITFQAIGYLVEIKRGDEKAERHFGHFATYLLLFTKIIAGPVERAHHFLPQLKVPAKLTYENFVIGGRQIIWGLFKKLVVADRLALYVGAVYNNYTHHSGSTLFFATVCYVFQIYADFSGYTDMALGFSKMMGYNLMPNFNRPFLAKSVTEFWRRWHISLSTWFADYFYNPLAVAKRDWGIRAIIFSSFVTFTVLGFWHGANWTYVVFGFLQGIILAIEIFTRKQRKNIRKKIPVWLNDSAGILFTVAYFGFSSIFFRANSVGEALTIIKKILHFNGPFFFESASLLMFMLMGIFYIVVHEIKKEYFDDRFTLSNNKYWLIRNSYYCMLIIIILITGVFDGGEFIYFQF